MRLLYFDPETNHHEGLQSTFSEEEPSPEEVTLVTSGDALLALISAVAEAFEALPRERFADRIGASPEQALDWLERLARISDVTYVPR